MHIQMRFTLLQCKGEIGHHHMPLATSSNPPNPWNHEIGQRPDQHTGNSMPYSMRLVCGFFNVPRGMNIEVLWDGAYGLSSLSEKTRKSNHLQMS